MDAQRFDQLTRRLATAASRRAVLRGAAASVIGGLLALAGASPARAASDKDKPKKDCVLTGNGLRCDNGKVCCNGRCVKPCADGVVAEDCDCFGLCCPSGETCSFADGTCYCTSVGQFGASPCGATCCVPDATACHIEDLGGGHERYECRPCVPSGPKPPDAPCCNVTSCSGDACTCSLGS